VCAFSSGRARSSVLGVRPSALIRSRVSGPRCQVPGTGVDPTPKAGYRGPSRGYRVPDSVFGLRFSAFGLDEACGKVASPSPLIPPWPRAGYRTPKTESETRIRGLHPTSCILYPASCILHPASCILHPYIRSRVPDTWDPIPGTKSTPRARYQAPRTEPEGQEAIRGCGRSHPFLG
jgi:hypothetical protein